MNPTLNKIRMLGNLPGLRRYYRRAKGQAPLPVNITLSLLYSCNSRCKTCNVYEKKVANFTVAEYEKTLAGLAETPYWYTLSGGEPFLRKDIVDICKVVYETSKPGIINIPTNGSLYRIIPEKVEQIVRQSPGTEIIINLSLDEIGDNHNEIRGFPDNWRRAMETYRALKELQSYPNFTLGIHTVISNFNVQRFPEIYKELIQLDPDSYITEIAEERVELGTMGTGITPDFQSYSNVIDFLISETLKTRVKGMAKIARAFRMEYYEMVKKFLLNPVQIIPCYAGVVSAQISPDGHVWPCCIRADSMGNLRDHNYNFEAVWNSAGANEIRRSIKNKECACPLANAGYTNLLLHPSSMAKISLRLLGV